MILDSSYIPLIHGYKTCIAFMIVLLSLYMYNEFRLPVPVILKA